jgi:hypothetical protein
LENAGSLENSVIQSAPRKYTSFSFTKWKVLPVEDDCAFGLGLQGWRWEV